MLHVNLKPGRPKVENLTRYEYIYQRERRAGEREMYRVFLLLVLVAVLLAALD
jgi:hypothetical protein